MILAQTALVCVIKPPSSHIQVHVYFFINKKNWRKGHFLGNRKLHSLCGKIDLCSVFNKDIKTINCQFRHTHTHTRPQLRGCTGETACACAVSDLCKDARELPLTARQIAVGLQCNSPCLTGTNSPRLISLKALLYSRSGAFLLVVCVPDLFNVIMTKCNVHSLIHPAPLLPPSSVEYI